MMALCKSISWKLGSCLAGVAIALAVATQGATCWHWAYQPEVPDELK